MYPSTAKGRTENTAYLGTLFKEKYNMIEQGDKLAQGVEDISDDVLRAPAHIQKLLDERKALVQNAPSIFVDYDKTIAVYQTFLDHVARQCKCKKRIFSSQYLHTIYCKQCAFAECQYCAIENSATNQQLTHCP